MNINDLTVEVRDGNLARVGQLLPADLVGFKAVIRFRNVGNWSLTLPVGHAMAEALRQPNAGLIVTGANGVLFSGPTRRAMRSQTRDDRLGTWEISGVTDEAVLGERLAYPTPSTADVTAQTSDYDTRTGLASTVMYQYVQANIGSTAPVLRQVDGLTLATDSGIGSTVTGKARFDVLGVLLDKLASIDGLGFEIVQNGAALEFRVYEPVDRSAYVRMDVENNRLSKAEYTYTAPTATRAIVAGSGAGVDRTFVEVTTADSTAAEGLWGRRIEVFKDARSSGDLTELAQTGVEELADKGKTIEAISVSPNDDLTMVFGSDWYLGDRVSVVVGDATISQIVTEVGFSIAADGVRIGATVGEPAAVDTDAAAETSASQDDRISNLERNEPASGGGGLVEPLDTLQFDTTYASGSAAAGQLAWSPANETLEFMLDGDVTLQIGQEHVVRVKNASGSVAIPDFSLVMFAGATGDTVTVLPATNTGTTPAHYLVGVTTQEIPADGFGFVTVQGFINKVNTASWAVGQLLYASSTTAGALTSTVPSAPSIKTPLVAVTRQHETTGRVLVRMTYDPTLGAIPDVSIASPATGDVLQRDGSGIWANKSLASAGISAVGHGHAYLTASPSLELTKTSTQSITASTQTTVTAWTVTRNAGGFTYSNGVVTVPTTGRYSISVAVQWQANATGYRMQRLLIDGTLFGGTMQTPGASVSHSGNIAYTDLYLTAGQTLEMAVFHNSSVSLTVGGTTYPSKFLVTYLGT